MPRSTSQDLRFLSLGVTQVLVVCKDIICIQDTLVHMAQLRPLIQSLDLVISETGPNRSPTDLSGRIDQHLSLGSMY